MAPPLVTPPSVKGREYILDAVKGTGEDSTVWKAFDAFDLREENPFAVKAYLPDKKSNRMNLEKVVQELQFLHMLSGSPYVASCVDHSLDSRQPYIVLEYIPGTLQDRFNAHGGITQELIVDYIVQIPELLSLFRDRSMAHCDLKATNVGYVARTIKVMDFGNAIELSCKEREVFIPREKEKEFLMPYYNPPEMRCGEYRMFTATSDVYSAGKLLQHLLIGSHKNISTGEALEKIESRFGVQLPRSFVTLLSAMIHDEYPQRPAPEDLKVLAHYAASDLQKKSYFDPERLCLLPVNEIKYLPVSSGHSCLD